jgi:hypothetical protein
MRMELSPFNVRDAGEIERTVTSFARGPNGGLIVPAAPLAAVHRDLIVRLAARFRLPAVYSLRYYVAGGGLIGENEMPSRTISGSHDCIFQTRRRFPDAGQFRPPPAGKHRRQTRKLG